MYAKKSSEALDEIWTRSDSEDESVSDSGSESDPCDNGTADSPKPSTSGLSEIRIKHSIFSALESDEDDNVEKMIISPEYEIDIKEISPLRNRQWLDRNLQPKIHDFDATDSGCKANVNENSSILEYFQIFFSEDLMSFVADETNNFYMYIAKNNHKVHSRLNTWKRTTCSEMYCFIAATMLMAQVKKLTVAEYWSTDKLIKTEVFSDIMARDRYLILLRMLHFNDNNEPNRGNHLIKIQALLDKLRLSCKTSFYPFQNLCLNESSLLFKGRYALQRCIPPKRSKHGIKTFVLCDCDTGYILDIAVCEGTSLKKIANCNQQIAMMLLEPYLGKGHTLYVCNRFTSPALFVDLHRKKTNACGAVKKRQKGMPRLPDKLQNGDISFKSTDTLLALKWHDQREVWMLSTLHSAETTDVREKERRTNESTQKPTCIIDYNFFMGAVDRSNVVISSIESVRTSTKWYKKIFFHMLDICICNAYSLHKIVTRERLSIAKFQLKLVREILEKYHQPRSKTGGGKKSNEKNPLRLTERHFPSLYRNNSATRKSPVRKCIVCVTNGRRRESRYECRVCDVGLCVVPCFEVFHTKKTY